MTTSPPLLIAHRAGNHVDSLRAAEAAGADLIEADVWFYRGQLEVRHLKTMGPVPLLWDRWELAPAWQPRVHLEELITSADPGTRFMFDLKGTNPLGPEVLAETLSTIASGCPYWVCSRSWDLLDPFRRHPEVQVAHSVGSRAQLATVWKRLNWHTNHAVSIHRRYLNPASVQVLREKAALIITWPINTRDEFDAVRDLGVDGITSDNPALIRTLAAERQAALS